MKFLKTLFFEGKKQEKVKQLMKITNAIEPLLDKTVHDIFLSYAPELISKPITYIVPAVWGGSNEGQMTPIQLKLNKKIEPVIDEIIRLFGARKLETPQRNAVDYLLRSLMISKITFMIERFKNHTLLSTATDYKVPDGLEEIEPIGNA